MNSSFRHKAFGHCRAACAGVTAASLLLSTSLDALAASAGTLLSPSILARASGTSTNSASNPQSLLNSPALQAQQALSAANLARAAKNIADMTAAQSAATASSQLTLGNAALNGSSWNGSPLSGLNPQDTDPTLWINADPLKKDAASATATVKQNAANALLTWQSFDLNKGEKLIFDQQGNADWSVLNRVVAGPRDANGSRFVASPSMILGSIQAPGSVYVINPNGVVFGPTAQVNVHSLIASSLDIGAPTMTIGERNSTFLNIGILGTGGIGQVSYNANDQVLEGDVIVQAGAQITTNLAPRSISPDAGGFVYLFAPNVENRGTITTPAGETLMVAAQAVLLNANAYPDVYGDSTPGAFRAVGVDTVSSSAVVWRSDGPLSAQISAPGRVTNSGLINAERGIVILNGDVVTNGSSGGSGSGVIQANTSITRNGQVFLDARLQLNLGGSVQILPTENGETIPTSALSNFSPGSIEMRGLVIDMEPGTLIEAPGAAVSISAPDVANNGIYPDAVRTALNLPAARVYMASDSIIDVSGLLDVSRPMSDNFLTFKPFGNEFADQPLQRNGALRGQALTVDLRQSGSLNGVNWIGTPLANLAGFATSAPQTIDQLLTTGGNVSLTSPNGAVVLRQGSSINVGGGSVQYAAGSNSETKLLTADGRTVSISRADPLETYIGVAGTSALEHPHWGSSTTETFETPLLSGAVTQPGYTEGRDAGAIAVNATAYVLEGDLYGGVVAGERQRALGQKPSAGDSALAMPNAGSFTIQGLNNLTVAGTVTPLANFDVSTLLPSSALATTTLSARKLSDAGFGKISAAFLGQLLVASDATLTAALGGTISLSGGSVDIEGSLVAPSGSITVTSTAHIFGDSVGSTVTTFKPQGPAPSHQFDLVIGSSARLDASGLWVNDSGASPGDLIGGAYIDGGSISLQTQARDVQCQSAACLSLPGLGAKVPAVVDLTGDVVLNQGALLDVSSGGRITDRGQLVLDAKGRVAGKGGNVSLATYVGSFPNDPVTTAPLAATVRLGGSDGSPDANAAAIAQLIHAYGFAQGGSLSLQELSFDIGAAGSQDPAGLALPTSFFNGNAFGAYNLTSVGGHAWVAPGASVVLRQRNLIPDNNLFNLTSGAKVSESVSVGFLQDFLRQPVNLALSAKLLDIPPGPYDPATAVPPSTVAVLIGAGALVQGDAGAQVTMSVVGRGAYAGQDSSSGGFVPPIAGQTAVAEILGTISAPAGAIALTGGAESEIWLGANSRLDAAGAALTDPRQILFRSGKVLPGGSVSINSSAAVIGVEGAVIDVSGASAEFDLPADAAPNLASAGPQTVATTVWSDAGTISLKAPTLLYDGGFIAHGGSASANGGTLVVSAPDTGSGTGAQLTVRQGGDTVPGQLQPGDALGSLTGSAIFLADRLNGSGIQSLDLSLAVSGGDAINSSSGAFSPGRLMFSGNVNLGGVAQLFLDASQIALTDTGAPTDPGGCNVCLDAGYVALRGAGNANQYFPAAGNGILQIAADSIDIAAGGGVFASDSNVLSISGAGKTNFISQGDIRLRIPLSRAPQDLVPGSGLPTGELISAGDISMTAAQIYPASDISFIIKSIAAQGTISFTGNGASRSAPLSAGGQLTVSAANIRQNGVLLAPLGIIRLGAQTQADLLSNDPTRLTMIPTQSVTFGAGSITSVSLNGQTVPFGQTANGASWSYDSSTGRPMTQPPGKDLIVSSAAISLNGGATIDLTGGGDLQAIEFVPGTGGTRDVLAGSSVYAIIPGYNPAAAPVDLDFLLQRHDALPAAGSTVYLSGQGSLPAGFYTLLPAHYASLPGAYRVAVVPGSTDALVSQNKTLADGTSRMAGYFANSTAGTSDARRQYFDVQSAAVWGQYSEIDKTGADSFFGAKPSASGVVPKLPSDAGHAVFAALSAITLQGSILSASAADGRSGELDIVAQDIQVLSPGAVARSGYVGLDATQLSNLDVDSLMLGGIRSDSADGETVTMVSNSIEISNDASAPLQRPEVILVTQVGSRANDPNANRALTLDAGSVVQAVGTPVNSAPKKLIFGNDAQLISGNGSLVAVSNGAALVVERHRANSGTGVITLAGPAQGASGPGATLRGNSLTIDTSGNIRPGTGVTLNAKNIAITAKSINFGTSQTTAGLNINGGIAGQLQQAANLTLRSLRTMSFTGPVDFSLAGSGHLTLDASALTATTGAVRLGAGQLDLVNTTSGLNPNAAGSATLELAATTIGIGSGTKSLSGFGEVTLSSSEIVLSDTGVLDAGAATLSLQTPLLLVSSRSDQELRTTGDVQLFGTGAAIPAPQDQVGGKLALTGGSISLAAGSSILATAGNVALTATAGDISLGANATIQTSGYVSTFFDVTRVVGGGAVQLTSNQGSIDIDPTARIDVSSPTGQPGYAGQIELRAATGNILSQGGTFDMAVIAGSVAGDGGGRLIIDTQSLGSAFVAPPTLFDAALDLRLRSGDVQLASGLHAATISITADGGTLTVTSTVDASGAKGGTISLFGQNGVTIAPGARLLATASDASKRGGDIVIGTEAAGVLNLAGGLIDVSNTANAANGGTVRLRAPLTGAVFDDVAINPVATKIQGASSVTIEGFRVFDNSNGFNSVIDPANQPGFFGSCDTHGVCSGTLIDFVQNFALSATAKAKFSTISPDALHLQPGIELVNNDLSVNNGDITVASAWNLGSGVAGYLVAGGNQPKNQPQVPVGTVVTDATGKLKPEYAFYTGTLLFVPGTSQVTSLNYRVGGVVTGEAGTLTLRAARDVNIDASITDGFFSTRNVFDAKYQARLNEWISNNYFFDSSTVFSNVGGYLIAGADYASVVAGNWGLLAPYEAGANGVSPSSSSLDKAPIAGADLFPLIGANFAPVGSWSYRIVAGADTASANPLAVQSLSTFTSAQSTLSGHGNVVIDGHTQFGVLNPFSLAGVAATSYIIPTIVRTGTGSIDIAAGQDFILADQKAPGVVYTAGRNSVDLPDPGFVDQTITNPFDSTQSLQIPLATDPTGFLKPVIISCDLNLSCSPSGPPTEAAYPVAGGHLTLTAQRDIVGFQHTQQGINSTAQFFSPWLIAQGTALSSSDAGAFSPLSAYLASGGNNLYTPSQTSWWINFGSFDQGLMSVGGDVTVKAGRDIQELSVSLPTTARVSGGLSNTIVDANGNTVANVPVVHFNGSGDLTVIAGRNLKSGAYYEGSGTASITIGGSISASWSIREDVFDVTSAKHPISTVLAVDTGRIALEARGNIDLAGIVSAASLQDVADFSGVLDVQSQSVSSYGSSSAVSLLSAGGDIIANALSFDNALAYNRVIPGNNAGTGRDVGDAFPGVGLYPANFEAVAANGNILVAGPFQLAASEDGTLNLLAHDSLATVAPESIRNSARPISTGPSVIEIVFDPVHPLSGFVPPSGSVALDLGARLLHQDDDVSDRLYAATGDITAAPGDLGAIPLAWEITKPAKVQAQRDIIDLSFFGQNLASTDVTSIVAGRDIVYTGVWQDFLNNTAGVPNLGAYQNLGGLSLAGPGFFTIQAGRDLGPFVTAAADVAASSPGIVASDPIGTGIVTFGNTLVVGNRRMFGSNPSLPDAFAFSANNELGRRGADIVALFGVANGIDYASVIKNYINPTTSTSPRDYIPALQTYLQTLGYASMSRSNAWITFKSLSTDLQDIFADKVFLSEIKLPGQLDGCCYKNYSVAYSMINTLFPASLGYTDNNVTGNAQPVMRATGNLDLLHATIKTLQSASVDVANNGGTSVVQVGGDIMLLGPGGGINVGTTATEINTKLTNSSLGILTLDNGAISSFTDASVLVNQSRVLTVQGGDILMFSSNGDLDAGRGAKTTVDFKPLSVIFSPTDLQTINLNGLVSGAGIGTIRSTPDAPTASASLIAPHGTVNAGDAGLRASGNLDIVALLVLNAANIAVAGSVSGVPQANAVNIGALESTGATGGQAARIANDSVAAAANRGAAGVRSAPSLVTVEVLGFGDCDPESGRACPAN